MSFFLLDINETHYGVFSSFPGQDFTGNVKVYNIH